MLRRALLRPRPVLTLAHCRSLSSVQHGALSAYFSQPSTPESHRAAFKHYASLTSDLHSTRLESQTNSVTNDPDLSALFKTSIADLESLCADALSHLKETVLDPPLKECSRVLVEVSAQRAGADGADFTAYLKRMWQGLAAHCGWTCVVQEADYYRITIPKPITGGGEGYRHLVLSVSGDGVWDRLRFERGLHRLTVLSWKGKLESTDVRVMVFPVLRHAPEELYNPSDIRTETLKSSGPGGQHVNKTESAIRLTHVPTGISVLAQQSRSQQENKVTAYETLEAKLLAAKMEAQEEKERIERRAAARVDRVRTYQFHKDNVIEHRLDKTDSLNMVRLGLVGDGRTWLPQVLQELGKADLDERWHAWLQRIGQARDGQ